MISRILVTLDQPISQRDWDDFCQERGLSLRPTGYFAANGLHAGCEGYRASFFTARGGNAAEVIASYAISLRARFGGTLTPDSNLKGLNLRGLLAVGA